MENFIFGIQSLTTGMAQAILSVSQYSLFWGFAFGFFVSTLMHGFLITENPRQVPSMLLRSSAKGFEQLHKKGQSGAYEVSYAGYMKKASHVKFVFGAALTVFAIIVLVAMLQV